jgi:hypothetical protein
MKQLTKEEKCDIAAIAAMKDSDIDFSDMPEVLDWSGAEIGRFYRPKKKALKKETRTQNRKKRPSRKSAVATQEGKPKRPI